MINRHKKTILALFTAVVIGTFGSSTITATAASVELPQAAIGIDVSRYQGEINWDLVKASGIQFVMIRAGYREQTGVMNEDPYVRYNLSEANRVGIKTGVYYYSTAITAEEAVEEATWLCNLIDGYQITYPVVYDCERFNEKSSRQYSLSKETRTALATIFMDTVANRGYTPMFYSNKNSMENNRYWNMDTIAPKYKVWVASYPTVTFPQATCNYAGVHSMWQYSEKGVIAGINANVDMNVAYFDYSEIAAAKNPSVNNIETSNLIANVQYRDVLEVVSTNTAVNLRTEASTDNPNTIVAKINKGDMIWRVGVGNNGWSKVKLPNSDQIYYAYSQYLIKVQ